MNVGPDKDLLYFLRLPGAGASPKHPAPKSCTILSDYFVYIPIVYVVIGRAVNGQRK